MQAYQENISAKVSGVLSPVLGVQVTVTDIATGNPAALYSDNGVTSVLQPLVTDETGYFGFYAANGTYSVAFTSPQIILAPRVVQLYDPADDVPLTQAQAAAPSGSSKMGFQAAGINATARSVENKLHESVSLLDFVGADPTGATESTAAASSAVAHLSTFGGGIVWLPLGTYMLKDLVIDHENILFVGETSGLSYNQDNSGVIIKPAPGAVFSVRLKGTRDGVPVNASEGSGFKNVQFNDSGYTAEYNLFIDSGLTVLEDVTLLGSDYNCVIADQANDNVFRKVSMRKGKYTDFAVTEYQAAAYLHPNVPDISSISNTTIYMEDVNIRQGLGFGVVIRSLLGAAGRNVTIESHKQGGLYIYRPDNATVRNIGFEHWWLENNYEDYVSGSTGYSITNNRMLWIAANTTIEWDSTVQAGFQMVIDSQTRSGGGSDSLDFYKCGFHNAGTQQKSFRILSGFKHRLEYCAITGGDTVNRCKVDSNAVGTKCLDLIVDNDPNAVEQSLVANYGANLGTNGIYLKTGIDVAGGEIGATYAIVGAQGGPVHFLPLDSSDPRRNNPNLMHDYKELDAYSIPWRTGSASPFSISSEVNVSDRHGRKVFMQCKGTLTVTATTSGQDKFFCNAFLPYQAAAYGHVVGQVVIKPTGGGASVVNNGVSPMEMNDIASAISVLNVFPVLSVGMTFSYQVELTYTTST